MWVCTSFGVLMPGLRPAHTVPEGDNRTLQVRARRKKDLEILREKYMGDDLTESIALPHTDYEWRAYCTPQAWGRALAKIGEDIDYVKFKETAETKYKDKDLHDLYLSMWATIFSHLSTTTHQADYWSGGLSGSKGKYGTTYGGTGNFSYGGKKGKHRKAGTRGYSKGSGYAATGTGYPAYDPDLDPGTYLGQRPWWADAEDDGHHYPYQDEDDLGLYGDLVERGVIVETLRTEEVPDTFNSLLAALEMMDPYHRPKLLPSGDIDHVYCDHGISKSAKKRCRARWRREARRHANRVRETLNY